MASEDPHRLPPGQAGNTANTVGRPWRTVFILQFLYVVSMLDRNLMALLVQPIKQTLGISDFAISLLQGTAFGLFYALCGFFAGWLLDTFPRRRVVFCGVTLWSLSTAGCGLASSFWQLLVGRFGVGSGEAVLSPASYAMISDQFPPRKLGFAMGVWATGSTLGGAMSLLLGGLAVGWLTTRGSLTLPLLGTLAPWQQAFLLVGLPGVIVAPMVFLIWRGVDRPKVPQVRAGDPENMALGAFLSSRWRYLAFHFFAYGMVTLVAYGQSAWVPTYLLREFHVNIAEAGAGLAMASAGGGLVGFLVSGHVTDRWQARGMMDAHFRYSTWAAVGLTLSGVAAMLAPSPALVICATSGAYVSMSISGIAAANLQLATPAHLRARVSSLYIIAVNVTGLCCGPSVVAAFTDFLFHDPARVGSSIMLTYVIFGPLAVIGFHFGRRASASALDHLSDAAFWTEPAESH